MFKEQTEKYLYRRQYLLAPHLIVSFGNWKQIQVSQDYFLTAHPDLSVTVAHCQNRSIYLLGYIIDPYNPSFDDSQIMQDVIDKSKTADDVFVNIAEKCGRFVIIVKIDNDFRIFSDACGLRQVFYHVDKNNSVWCSSQPHIIAQQLGIEVNEMVKSDLQKTSLFRSGEHWYPGNITLFDNILHLTPNHYLDGNSGKFIRYWPKVRLNPISMSECIPKVSELLSGIIEGAMHRFNIAFAISCGLDSRTLFATSRKAAKNIHYFTQISKSGVHSDPDVLIPSAMLKQLGLKHSVMVLPEQIDEDFKTILEKNVFTARTAKGLNATSVYNQFKDEKKEIVIIYGNCSEITKRDRFRFPKTPKPLISGTVLAGMALMSQSNIAVDEFAKWLVPVKKLTKYNVDILDLMHWEQRVGNWGAMTFSEYEMVHESLCPYSCRAYIEYMLRVPFKYRTNSEYKLHHEIIAANWPEALEFDINPENNRIIKGIEDFLYRTNLYDPIKFLHIMLYKRFK
ncbi:MAG: hypothetical protein WCJ37_00105 [Syntrophus sp. (in: bacteria)]